MSEQAAYIAGDWGSTHLRLYLCAAAGVLAEAHGPGIAQARSAHAEVIADATRAWRQAHGPLPLLLAGMVGSRNGWVEVPYVECPADAAALRAAMHRFESAGQAVALVPGLACTNPLGAPDVMRGEETQILGALALAPELARGRRVLALPGTHCKWVQVEDGRIVRFQSGFAGELFQLLRQHSLLAGEAGPADDPAGYALGLERADAATTLPHVLFEARSRQLRAGLSAAAADAFLSGLVIGSDVRGALPLLQWQAQAEPVVLVGAEALCRRYAQALARHGHARQHIEGADAVLAGLRVLAEH